MSNIDWILQLLLLAMDISRLLRDTSQQWENANATNAKLGTLQDVW